MSSLSWPLFISLIFDVVCLNTKSTDDDLTLNAGKYPTVIVHLFEWKWLDVADECERFLGPKGYAAVQLSPASENLIMYLEDGTRPWYERYQVMSYIIHTRSGSEVEFLNMTTRCNNVGVRVYVDVVLNHMTTDYISNKGTANSRAHFEKSEYPAVPYKEKHFHPPCELIDYDNATEVRNCKLAGLKDLDHDNTHVRSKIIEYLNKLISLGVAGFRVDAAKHMWPEHLMRIYEGVDNLSTDFGFLDHTRPYIYQEVYPGGAVRPFEYREFADVTEFLATEMLYKIFNGQEPLISLGKWGTTHKMLPSHDAVVFVDNHDTQRYGGSLNYKDGYRYKAALAFLLAHPYGQARIISSYFFDTAEQGPPSDADQNIRSPIIDEYGLCDWHWVCEHRWFTTVRMIQFRNIVSGTSIQRWWDNGHNQIAFSRGRKGFIAINIDNTTRMRVTLQTGLPRGSYCDLRSGQAHKNSCTGKTVTVQNDGRAKIKLSGIGSDLYVAIHIGPQYNDTFHKSYGRAKSPITVTSSNEGLPIE